MSTGKAKELAREAVAHYFNVGVFRSKSSDENDLDYAAVFCVPVAEYAVNLALEAACKTGCYRCEKGDPAEFRMHRWRHSKGEICRAAAIRAMMDSGRPA